MARLGSRFLMAFVAAGMICFIAAAVAHGVEGQIGWAAAAVICGAAGGLILATWGCAALYRLWLSPLEKTIDRGTQIVQADWRGQIAPDGAWEIQSLSAQFNRLAVETHRRLSLLEHQQADLNALVDTLPDPILAGDTSGRLILMNAPAATLLGISAKQAIGQMVVSVVADEPVVELIDAASALRDSTAHSIQREIRLSRGGQKLTFQAVAARTAAGGPLVVLRDVSTLARAIQMKTDFVANASHELRTPITAIKIAFETLGEAFGDDPEQAQKCMLVIDGHLKRLEDMLRDLLDLSRVEGPEHEGTAVVKSADLFNAIRGTLLPLARQKLVELDFNNPDPAEFVSDWRLLNLILKNLVENGVKYTPVGGKVTVSLTPANGDGNGIHQAEPNGRNSMVLLKVSDTGIGIAPEHIDRVFERFYQVDSARSGSAGRGTGLGLAIVKHAVLALGGSVTLQSEVGVGTTVTCVLPQSPVAAVGA